MKKWSLVLWVVVLAGSLFLGSTGSVLSAPKEILLGTPAPLTGMAAGFGQGGVFGLKAAVEDINKLGGVYVKEYGKKLPVKMLILDNQSDPRNARMLAENLLVEKKVNFLVSPALWPPTIAAIATAAEKHQTPYLGFCGPFEPNHALRMAGGGWKQSWLSGFAIGAPPPKGDFRNKPGYTIVDLWMGFLGRFMDQTNKKVGVFAADDADGRGWYESFPKALKGAGFQMIGTDKELGIAPMGSTDFTAAIREWKKNDCEILVGNAPPPWFGTLWRQCRMLGFKPKMVVAERAAMVSTDVASWGGDLALGVTTLLGWVPTIKAPGIGDTTPKSLDQRWRKASNQPSNQFVGWGYSQPQILFNAIERAGTLDKKKVHQTLAKTDMMTIIHRAKYDVTQFSRFPVVFGQWFKVDSPHKWDMKVIFSQHDFYPVSSEPLFPIPYK